MQARTGVQQIHNFHEKNQAILPPQFCPTFDSHSIIRFFFETQRHRLDFLIFDFNRLEINKLMYLTTLKVTLSVVNINKLLKKRADRILYSFQRSNQREYMYDLPAAIIHVLTYFAPIFSRPIFQRLCLLFKAHILSKGRRTVCDLLRCLGREDDKSFSMFHRVFYGAKWSELRASKILFQLILKSIPASEITVSIDSHVERRKGPHIKGLGIQRDAVHSTKNRKVLIPGLNWLVSTVVVQLPWTCKKWALPFLTILLSPKAPLSSSKNENDKKKLSRHKKLTDWTCQIAFLLRRWAKKTQRITLVADSAFACFKGVLGLYYKRDRIHISAAHGCSVTRISRSVKC